MIVDKKTFGERLRARIDASGKSRERVASEAGVTASTVFKACSGKHEAGVISAARIAAAVGSDLNSLVEMENVTAPDAAETLKTPEKGYLATLRSLTSGQRQALMRMAREFAASNRATLRDTPPHLDTPNKPPSTQKLAGSSAGPSKRPERR